MTPVSPIRTPQSLLLCILLAAASPAVAAPGIGLAWNQCFGEAGAVQNAAFACDTNTGSHRLEASFELSSPMSIVIGVEMVFDLASASPTLPSWWQLFYAGSCRPTSLAADFLPDPGDVQCTDWSVGLSAGGLGGYCTAANATPVGCGLPGQPLNTARIKGITAVASQFAQDLAGLHPYFAFGIRINHEKTVGDGACGGCTVPVCIVFNSINVVARNNVENRYLTAPQAPGANFVTWQGGGAPVVGTAIGCPAATAVRRSSWGEMKSLYR